MDRKVFIHKLLREGLGTNTIIYHGTPNKHDFNDRGQIYGGTFFSPNENEARSYGEFVYKVALNPNINLFDSTNLLDANLLFSEFHTLYDFYYGDDEEDHYIKRPEQLIYNSDNWNPIEQTDGVLEWIESNYDGVIITEGGVPNIFLFSPVKEKINFIKLVS